jgi:hypothetical protein
VLGVPRVLFSAGQFEAAHNEASLCQVDVFGLGLSAWVGIAGGVPRLVVALLSGFGSDLSEEPAVQDLGWPRGTHEAFLVVLPDPVLLVVAVGDEGSVDGV